MFNRHTCEVCGHLFTKQGKQIGYVDEHGEEVGGGKWYCSACAPKYDKLVAVGSWFSRYTTGTYVLSNVPCDYHGIPLGYVSTDEFNKIAARYHDQLFRLESPLAQIQVILDHNNPKTVAEYKTLMEELRRVLNSDASSPVLPTQRGS